MKSIITILGSGSGVYDIATYTNFHQEMYRMLSEFNYDKAQTFMLTEKFMQDWRDKIDILVDANKVVRATLNTEKLAEIDELRDRAISRFFNGIKFGLDSFEKNEVEAAKRLELIRKKYSGIQKLNYDRQTASVDGLLHDLSDVYTQNDIATLNLSAMEQKIAETNAEFRRLYGETSNTRAASKLPTFVELRNEMSPIWEEVVQHIQAGYIFAKNDEVKLDILWFADALNQRIKQIKDNFNRSQATRKKETQAGESIEKVEG